MWRVRSYPRSLPPERRGRRAPAPGVLLVAATLLLAFGAQAQPFRYTVELEVPKAQRALLEAHLEIYTARQNPRMDADQLRLLV